MAQRKLVRWTHVQYRNRSSAYSLQKLLARDWFQFIAFVEIAADNALNFGNVALCNPTQRRENVKNTIVGEGVIDELALTPRSHQANAPHVLEMLRSISNRQAGSIGKNFDAALALSELLQQLKAMGMPQRFRDSSELSKQSLFRTLA
jgi:hypothetical protein